jgi:hypothetical protein
LKLENGLIKLYTQEDIDYGRAIGLQKKPFVRQIDLIEHDFMSFITSSKEAKYKKTTDLNDKNLGYLKETQITFLPEMLKIPLECYDDQNKIESENLPILQAEEIEEESKEPKRRKQEKSYSQAQYG